MDQEAHEARQAIRTLRFVGLPLTLALLASHLPGRASAADEAALAFFESRIRPVLVEHCHECHGASASKPKGGLRVDARDALLNGGDSGPAIVPGNPDASLLWRAVRYDDPDLQMPPKTRLPGDAVAHLRRWIEMGAPWPQAGPASAQGPLREHFDVKARRAQHWAWQPVRRPEVPRVTDESWPRSDLDRFILAALEGRGLRPAPRADRRTLIRRATFALHGLPPTPAEVEAFVGDEGPDADRRLVDRLLASPAFGERWARHWLDKVRYAETMGHEFDYPILAAWRYRDYVINAFNDDLPYPRFVREQIAGDLDPEPRRTGDERLNQSVLATLQFWFCQQVHSPVDVRHHQIEVVDNQIDVLTKSFLGLTVSCARCHDHKFDAISTRDYYALYGILSSSRYAIRAVDDPQPRLAQARALAGVRDAVRKAWAAQLLEAWAGSEPTVDRVSTGRAVLKPGDHRLFAGDWSGDGEAFNADADPGAQPLLGIGPRAALVTPGWIHSASLARRFQGTLMSPTFSLDADYLHLRVAGRGARLSLVIEGFTLIRAPIYGDLRRAVQNEAPHWVTIPVSMWRGRRAWIEVADLSVQDPASTLGGDSAAADGWVAVGDAVLSASKEPPVLAEPEPLRDQGGPAGPEVFRALIERWRDAPGSVSEEEAAWLEAALRAREVRIPEDLERTWRSIAEGIRAPVLVGALREGTGLDEPVFIRGNPRTPGERVPRRFLEAVEGGPEPAEFAHGTGRAALARAMADPDNPLLARVMVNWVWAHLFGRGLVASVDNFGALGELPSHPELLDYLSDTFRREGWSVKGLIRTLMLSAAWQMQSRPAGAEADRVDPDNILLHRAHLRRLEGEALRDAMLAVSGRLDRTLGGPSVPVHLTPFMEGRGRPDSSGPLDGGGRRSLYLEVRRNFLSPFLLAFDTPVPATTVGQRSVSNVPAQALALMNDPFVAGQAAAWSERVACASDLPVADRVRSLYLEAFGRPPEPEERDAAIAFLEARRDGAGDPGRAAWADLCHALFNAKEFAFVE